MNKHGEILEGLKLGRINEGVSVDSLTKEIENLGFSKDDFEVMTKPDFNNLLFVMFKFNGRLSSEYLNVPKKVSDFLREKYGKAVCMSYTRKNIVNNGSIQPCLCVKVS